MLNNKSWKKIATFLGITLVISCIFYFLIISAGTLQAGGGLYVLLLMWTPGVAGIATQLIFEHSLKGLGWKPGKFKYLGLAYIVPVIYCLVVYGLTWFTGLGTFPSSVFMKDLAVSYPGFSGTTGLMIFTAIMATFGVVISLVSAMGEEIGWRGLLVPELAKVMPYTRVSLVSGVIWALWHMPLIFFADYKLPGVPVWYGALMFLIMVIGISFVFAWLRLRSGSLWTAALLHASHNLFVQAVFTPVTAQNSITPYIIDEFGCGLAIAIAAAAFLFWLRRKDLPTEMPATAEIS
jgi:membrane protease YdiL (CAAX protease family)